MIFFVICITLSLRIKGKIVIHWLSILIRYNLRAKYYIYNKNESYLRTLYLPTTNKTPVAEKKLLKAKARKKIKPAIYRIKNLVSLEIWSAMMRWIFVTRLARKEAWMWLLNKSKSKTNSRKQIAIKEVRNGIIVLPNKEYRLVIKTSSINFELKSEEEQDVIIDSYQNFLNSLPCTYRSWWEYERLILIST